MDTSHPEAVASRAQQMQFTGKHAQYSSCVIKCSAVHCRSQESKPDVVLMRSGAIQLSGEQAQRISRTVGRIQFSWVIRRDAVHMDSAAMLLPGEPASCISEESSQDAVLRRSGAMQFPGQQKQCKIKQVPHFKYLGE